MVRKMKFDLDSPNNDTNQNQFERNGSYKVYNNDGYTDTEISKHIIYTFF